MATVLGLILLLTLSAAPAAAENAIIEIQPHSVASDSRGGSVSVHTKNVDYAAGVPWTNVYLGSVEATYVKADDCGRLVAKFNLEAVKDMVAGMSTDQGTEVTLVFTATGGGVTYTGTSTVTIGKVK